MTTDRELKIKYIRDAKGEKEKEFESIRRAYLYSHQTQIADDLCERGRDAHWDNFGESWHDAADDYLISTIDWSVLEQCKNCDEYYDAMDVDSGEFCSEDCAAIYESENSKGKRRTNIFVK